MDKMGSFLIDNKVEIIDRDSPFFGKTCSVKVATIRDTRLIGSNHKAQKELIVVVTIDNTDKTAEFSFTRDTIDELPKAFEEKLKKVE